MDGLGSDGILDNYLYADIVKVEDFENNFRNNKKLHYWKTGTDIAWITRKSPNGYESDLKGPLQIKPGSTRHFSAVC